MKVFALFGALPALGPGRAISSSGARPSTPPTRPRSSSSERTAPAPARSEKSAGLSAEPHWSADSTKVAYVDDEAPARDQIWVGPADGSAAAAPITQGESHNRELAWKPGPGGPPPSSGGGGGGAGGGAGSGSGGGGAQGGQTPVKVRLAYLKQPAISARFVTPVSIDCHAQGGHPTGKVAEYCAAHASAYPQGAAPARSSSLFASASKKRPPLFARGREV